MSEATPQALLPHQPVEAVSPTESLDTLRKMAHVLARITPTIQRDVLLLQARCKVAGQDMDQDFDRVRRLLDQYLTLLKNLDGVLEPSQ